MGQSRKTKLVTGFSKSEVVGNLEKTILGAHKNEHLTVFFFFSQKHGGREIKYTVGNSFGCCYYEEQMKELVAAKTSRLNCRLVGRLIRSIW